MTRAAPSPPPPGRRCRWQAARWLRRFKAVLVAAGLAGCAPAFDWREFVPEGSGVRVGFPCRPDRSSRTVELAGARVTMQMWACSAGDATFALAHADLAEPQRVPPALLELRRLAVANLNGNAPRSAALQVPGMTPTEAAVRLSVDGMLPGGAAVQETAAFFSRGLRVYQATVIGARPPAEAVETFLGALQLVP